MKGALKNFYANFEEYCGVLCMTALILCLGIQIFLRFLFSSSLAWTEELSRFCFIWTIYMGGALAAKRLQHVRITAQYLLLPRKLALPLWVCVDAVWLLFNCIIIWHSVGYISHCFEYAEISPTLGWVVAYIYLCIPLSFLLMNVRIIENYVKSLKAGNLRAVMGTGEPS
jgi:TRAP-type C4-dicarboxylate transport system permease small subunit